MKKAHSCKVTLKLGGVKLNKLYTLFSLFVIGIIKAL